MKEFKNVTKQRRGLAKAVIRLIAFPHPLKHEHHDYHQRDPRGYQNALITKSSHPCKQGALYAFTDLF